MASAPSHVRVAPSPEAAPAVRPGGGATPEDGAAATDATRYRQHVDRHGLSPTHEQVIAWVPRRARVLEVGCASGYVGRLLIEDKGCAVTGIEIDAAAAREARHFGLDVLVGSVEDPAFRAKVVGPFDAVVAADVLEHLADPAPVLRAFQDWLAPGGVAIVAVPNVATWPIRHQLLVRGDFEYQETGILDRTHLHFFTWDTLHALVRDQGWRVEETMVDGVAVPFVERPLIEWPCELRERLDRLDRRRLGPGFAYRLFDKPVRGAVTFGQRVSRWLVRRWPNLCAEHVALLLSPPPRTASPR